MKDIISHLRDGAAAVFSRPVDGLQSVSKREFLKTGVGTAALATRATLGVRTAHACDSPTCAKNK
jgi:molybdopterin biosynthesis enzyme MoaB